MLQARTSRSTTGIDTMKVIFPILLVLALASTSKINSQSAHSRLTDSTLVKRFDALSHKLMCTCGCNMPLRNCNHTGHCNAWPARDALDKLLLAGFSDTQILDGFKNGFGNIADKSDFFSMAKREDYAYMLPQFRDGFGSKIFSAPESNYLAVFTVLGFILCAGVVALFIRARRKRKAIPETVVLDESKRQALLQRISHSD